MFVRTEVEREQTPDGSFYADDSIRVVCVTLFNYYTQTQHAQPNANKKKQPGYKLETRRHNTSHLHGAGALGLLTSNFFKIREPSRAIV